MADSRDRAAWLLARSRYLCGSEVAAALGESKYQTRDELRMLKAGLAEPFAGNETTRHGQYLEAAYFALAAKGEFGWELEPHGMLVEDALCPQLAATPDFVMSTPYGPVLVQTKGGGLQAQEDCKPRKDGSPSEAAFAQGCPVWYALQLQAEMACTGYQLGALLVLHVSGGAMKLRAYPVRRHELLIARIRREAVAFMADVQALKEGRLTA